MAKADADERLLGLARLATGACQLQLSQLDASITSLRAASHVGYAADWPWLRGQARLRLASALVLRGQPERALATIDTALVDLREHTDRALGHSTRAAVLMELDRHEEALADLNVALPGLRRGAVRWQVLALSNRSLIWVARRSFREAEADLTNARDLAIHGDVTLLRAVVEQNLGCLLAGRGDVPAALQHFDAAERGYANHGVAKGSLSVDRAQVFLSIRLLDEAMQAAQHAVALFTRQRRWLKLPEAHLLVSTSALLKGDYDVAAATAAKAERSLRRFGRDHTLALARYARFQALQSKGSRAITIPKARAVAGDLERAGWTIPALEARVLAGRMALERGRLEEARTDLELAAAARRSGPADARARAWLAEAMLREADGRRREAYLALNAGLRVLESHRASMGASELRAHVSMHRGSIAREGLRMSLQDNDARRVHDWAERGRASALALRPVRPPDDETLAWYLEDLRATVGEIDDARDNGRSAASLLAHQQDLERTIRDHVRASPGSGPDAKPPTPQELCQHLGDNALVEIVEHERVMYAVTVVTGRWRLHELGTNENLAHWLKHVPFALNRLASSLSSAQSQLAAMTVLERAGEALESLLIAPLRETIGDRHLVLIPSLGLQTVPWSVLPSCRERLVSVAPSASLWTRAAQGSQGQSALPPVTVVAGPDLPGADLEAAAVAALYPKATLLAGEKATADAVFSALGHTQAAHIAAHGQLRADNPLFSAIKLHDGPFTVYDIERLDATPAHVVLAACETARSHVIGGQEILGLTAALLNRDTKALVAPVVSVADTQTNTVMVNYHEHRSAGSSPRAALAAAQWAAWASGDPQRIASAAAFVCLGDGA